MWQLLLVPIRYGLVVGSVSGRVNFTDGNITECTLSPLSLCGHHPSPCGGTHSAISVL